MLELFLCAVLALAPGESDRHSPEWEVLAPGMELGTIVATRPSPVGDSRVIILRIDPELWDLRLAAISHSGDPSGKTAREWCRSQGFAAVTNAGMYHTDHRTHVGYLRSGGHINSETVNHYQSVAAFDLLGDNGSPRFRIFDLDQPGVTMPMVLDRYGSVVQNLRLIKRPGENRWPRQDRMWSEAALGEDAEGRILFIFSRSPYSMHDLGEELLAADIDLVAAQHLEGGPEAQLHVKVGEVELGWHGSYETSFNENDAGDLAWPVPNVIGVCSRSSGEDACSSSDPSPPSDPEQP